MNDMEIAQVSSEDVSQQQERVLTQSEVDKVVGRVKAESYQKGQRDAMMSQGANNASSQQAPMSEDRIRELMRETANQATMENAQKAEIHRLVGEFSNKVIAGKEKYPDIEEKLAEIDIAKMPELVPLANGVDNTADVIYDLASNPYKIATIISSVRQGLPHLAQQEIRKLSNSIKENQKAQQNATPKEPLSQLKPSTAIPGDNGKMSVADFRKQSWLKR